jgi:hypothetical protein
MLFETQSEFSLHIETIALKNEIDLIDALLIYCEDNFIEPEDISNLINRSLRDKLEVEFQFLNWLPRTATLEFD